MCWVCDAMSKSGATTGYPDGYGDADSISGYSSWGGWPRKRIIFGIGISLVIGLIGLIMAAVIMNKRGHIPWRADVDGTLELGEVELGRLAVARGEAVVSNVTLAVTCKGAFGNPITLTIIKVGKNIVFLELPPVYEVTGCNKPRMWFSPLPEEDFPLWDIKAEIPINFSDIVTTHKGFLYINMDGEITIDPEASDRWPGKGQILRIYRPTETIGYVAKNPHPWSK